MPRLLRQLARFLEAESAGKIKYRQRRPKPNEQPKPTAQTPLKRPPILYKPDRTRSFLLDVNPLIDKELYHVPKELPPLLPSEQRMRRSDGRRAMNEVELDATASPYVRMLSSPLRTCLFTRAILPKDLMIRFGGAIDPATKTRYLLPNNIEHHKYRKQAEGKGFWVSCRKEAVHYMASTGMHGMAIPDLRAHAMILEQIWDLLQRRLVQELTLLRDRLQAAPHRTASVDEPAIRALTLEELHAILRDGTGELRGGAAIICFQEAPEPAVHHEENAKMDPSRLISDTSSFLGARFVPLYNAGAFLSASSSQAIEKLLMEILAIEIQARRKKAKIENSVSIPTTYPSPDSASQAYLIRSTSSTLNRVDTVPVCISLWRLRLWGGQGWGDSLWGPWEASPSPTNNGRQNDP